MKSKTKTIAVFAAIALTGFFIGRIFSPSGSIEHSSVPAENEPEANSIWTCSMHPQITQPEEGDCPICGMDLIPLQQDDGNDIGPRAMAMSESAKALADIETTEVVRDFPVANIPLVGHMDYDETLVKSIASRFPARIERLFINYEGVKVEEGDHLAMVYSPDLLTAQRELLTSDRLQSTNSIANVAREKLRLWGLLPEQIDEIIKKGEASDRFELKAPSSGIVITKKVNEGDYVQTGQTLFRIADLSNLWLYLNAFESDLRWLRYGQELKFTVEAWPGEVFSGQIAFIEPELNRSTRTVTVRVNVPNLEDRLKPGMFARGTVEVPIGQGGVINTSDLAGKWISPMHPEVIKDGPGDCDVCGMDLVPAESLGLVSEPQGEAPLVIPTSAVLRTGKRSVVYVQLPDRDKPTYEGREIVLGPRAGNVFVVSEGLKEGERVVTKGAFKIDSALQIQAKPSMMNPPEDEGESQPADTESITIDLQTAVATLPNYFQIQSALAADDIEATKKALKDMMAITGHSGDLPDLIHKMLAADTLENIRRPDFEILSNAFIEAVESTPEAFEGNIYLMRCPMVYDDRGADWLQSDEELLNPYFGASMLYCGEIVSLIESSK